jgi:phosphoribosylaminoimidazole (AIR) synthetase
MLRTFNMGLGMLLIVSPRDLTKVTSALKKRREKFWSIGRIIPGKPGVKYLQGKSV